MYAKELFTLTTNEIKTILTSNKNGRTMIYKKSREESSFSWLYLKIFEHFYFNKEKKFSKSELVMIPHIASNKPSITGAVVKMEKMGHIKRIEEDDQSGEVFYALTEEGAGWYKKFGVDVLRRLKKIDER